MVKGRTICWLGVAIWMVGCGGEEERARTASGKSWLLEADDKGGLVDVSHPEFAAYPNPGLVAHLEVSLEKDGTLCADDGTHTFCGGPVQGIPYRLRGMHQDSGAICVSVIDIYGNDIGVEDCTLELGGKGEPPAAGAASCESGESAKLVGAELFTNVFNGYLEKVGLGFALAPPTDVSEETSGEFDVGESACAEVLAHLDDEFSDDIGDEEDDVFGENAVAQCLEQGECRIGQLVTRAMAAACATIPTGCDVSAVSSGIVSRGGETIAGLCDDDDEDEPDPGDQQPPGDAIPLMGKKPPFTCEGSPLVLDLAGDGLSLRGPERTATFSLMGMGPVASGWLAGSDDALLALDVDGDGLITSGRELFGEATNGWARDGFAALARLDDNRDGKIDAADPAFGRLVAWIDDGDAVTQPGETRPLVEVGIDALPVASRRLGARDAFGNRLGLGAEARGAGGSTVPVIDVWFRLGSR